ncbi:hypothetical protein [Clostridium sp. ZS1]|uniref:hypothetical protein n=1 Tax=Clostridium sp. ZS1 TaxID=2949989 RepID=UPI00207932A2|nr:hypothetical protein [Clostridium sp. ZS1]
MKNCLKKILIMFVMVLIIMGIGAIQNGTIANAAIIGEQLLQPEAGWKRYDDNDGNISYIGDEWYYGSNIESQNGMLHANIGPGEVRFNFTGSKIRIISNADQETGFSDNIKITIDNNIIYTYSQNMKAKSEGMVLLYENTSLKNGTHTVKISKEDDSKYIEIDTIDIDGVLLPYEEIEQPEEPDKPDEDDSNKTGAILIINLVDGETKVYDVTTSEAKKFIDWYDKHDKETYRFDKDVNEKISVNEYVVHDKITFFEIRRY